MTLDAEGYDNYREWVAFDDYGQIPWAVAHSESHARELFKESDDVRVRDVRVKRTDWQPYRLPDAS